MQISEIQSQARELRSAQGWLNTTPEVRVAYLITEVGEVAREVIALQSNSTVEGRGRLGMEIYDVVWNLCDLANILGVDLEAAFQAKARLNRTRTWQPGS